MIISKQTYDNLQKLIERQKILIIRQSRTISRLTEENNQREKLIGLYEACIQKGVKIDFPNSEKGGNADNTGDIDFSDF